jgi:hypothetical protein
MAAWPNSIQETQKIPDWMDPIPFPPHRWQRCITLHSSASNLEIDLETKTQASPLPAEQSIAIRDRGQLPFAIKNQGRITICFKTVRGTFRIKKEESLG